jgi:HK97 gp10 family phage protein
MRMKIKLRVKGVRKAIRNMDRAERSRIIPALQRGIHKGGYIMEREIKKRSPVDTGRLRRSIKTILGRMKATVSTNVKYAPHQEFGTSKMRAHPYMRPGARASVKRIEKTIAGEVKRAISSI